MNRQNLEQKLNEILTPHVIKDYCPNGLQVQGKSEIKKIVTGVTASQALIDKAVELKADALLVHHGYFWKGEPSQITGMKYNRIKTLIEHDINLFAYHLPLDIHPELGNNVQLGKLLGIINVEPLEVGNPYSVAVKGEFEQPMPALELNERITSVLSRQSLHLPSGNDQLIKTIAWCTGGGQDYIDLAASQGIDAFISGEVSERTTHTATELGIHYFAAGHHATERYGVKALGEYLSNMEGLEVLFVDVDNPV